MERNKKVMIVFLVFVAIMYLPILAGVIVMCVGVFL